MNEELLHSALSLLYAACCVLHAAPAVDLPIPAPNPIPIPGPEPLLHGLLVLTFMLHALFMNLVLGGTLITLCTDWLGIQTGREHYRRLAASLGDLLPTAMALAVVLGVGPLLFLQSLYGRFFYTASILIGPVWIAVIAVLITAYYGLYAYKYGRLRLQTRPALRLGLVGVILTLFLSVALVFVTMSVLMLSPERWRDIQAAGFAQAVQLSSVLPRYLHMVLAAVAGAGVVIALFGTVLGSSWGDRLKACRDAPDGYGSWVTRYGVFWVLAGTVPQIVIGPWLVVSLPGPVRGALLSGDSPASLIFFTALTCALLALVLLNAAVFAPHARGFTWGGVGSLLVTFALMPVVRDRVRHHWLAGHFDPGAIPTAPQWKMMGLFGILLLVAAAVVAYLVVVWVRSRLSEPATPGESIR